MKRFPNLIAECSFCLSGLLTTIQHLVDSRCVLTGKAEQRLERGHWRASSVESECELVEVMWTVFPPHAMMGALEPGLQIGEDPVAACVSISTAKHTISCIMVSQPDRQNAAYQNSKGKHGSNWGAELIFEKPANTSYAQYQRSGGFECFSQMLKIWFPRVEEILQLHAPIQS